MSSRGVRLVEQPDPAIVARMGDELTAFNFAATGIRDGREWFAIVEDEPGEPVGAAHGWTWGATCWVERLWVREADRGHGIGTDMLAAVETEARDRGCVQIALTTHSFQAPDFYRRLGFEIAGEVPDYPAGHAYFLMRKRF